MRSPMNVRMPSFSPLPCSVLDHQRAVAPHEAHHLRSAALRDRLGAELPRGPILGSVLLDCALDSPGDCALGCATKLHRIGVLDVGVAGPSIPPKNFGS